MANDTAPACFVEPVRAVSRRLVRELGFMQGMLAGTDLAPSAVHALVEIGARDGITAGELSDLLILEKSSVSRMLGKLVKAGEIKEGSGSLDGRTKPLHLTARGRATLARIDEFARRQVLDALGHISSDQHRTVIEGLRLYADALGADRTGAHDGRLAVEIEAGYRPGAIARCVDMHARYYARTAGFGRPFEAQVAAGLAEFAARLDKSCNQLWLAVQLSRIVGTVAIDGEDLGPGRAHLRWFIVDDGMRGGGVGRRLLAEAVAFCERQHFAECHLWTFRGLDAARRLYEAHGFTLVEEHPGRQWGEEVLEQRFVRQMR
ncbi:MAG: bifunctional helix-turn-helix transcriptional regulator/GNAT family N-acetyltransferase [Geminicoccaceae bacterium]